MAKNFSDHKNCPGEPIDAGVADPENIHYHCYEAGCGYWKIVPRHKVDAAAVTLEGPEGDN